MADEPEYGPDPNEIRRHAKKMYTDLQYRRKYRRIDFYKPNKRQLEFHNLTATEVMLRAGNQLGKTHAAGAQMAMDALALYPVWYQGRKFLTPPPIERPWDFQGWVACTTSAKTRDGAQAKLLGPVRAEGGLGTGLIPLENIVGRPTMQRGISDYVDTVSLTRETGGQAIIRFKSYEMDREGFQGEPVDVVWLDEDVSRNDETIYGEVLARLTTTSGRVMCSMTPLLGASPLRKRFMWRKGPDMGEILMTIKDCAISNGGHIPDEEISKIEARTPETERATRLYGADLQGEGAVFMTPVERITTTRDPATFPTYWPWLWGFDFSHSGFSEHAHPFAAVLGCWDRDNDIIYVVHAVRMRKALPVNHVHAIKQHPMWDAPVAWPHDGGRAAGLVSGETVSAMYRRLGLNMRPKNATFPDGGYNFEAGITEMAQRFETGRLLISGHLSEVFDEYRNYHRIDGLVNKIDDDLLSAMRVLLMDLRYARAPAEGGRFRDRRPDSQPLIADGVDFDVFAA